MSEPKLALPAGSALAVIDIQERLAGAMPMWEPVVRGTGISVLVTE